MEALLAATPPRSPDRPLLLRRLAENYAELARRSSSERITAELEVERERKAAKARTSRPQ